MRRTLLRVSFLLVTILSFLRTEGQVSVVLFTNPAKQFFIDDLWKSTVINTTTSPINMYLQFQIRTGASSNVLTLTTQMITLAPGANRLMSSEGAGGRWVYGNNKVGTIFQSMGKLPYGQYTYGITAFSATTNRLHGTSDAELEVNPMLPPELSSPRNEEIISIKYPVLTWIPPRPIIGLDIVYSLRMVAVQKNQSPAEGLTQNPPVLSLQGLSSTYTNYPASAQQLEPGITYAWQVGASYEGYSLGTTEIWIFTVKPPPPPPVEPIIYPMAIKVSDGHFYVTHGVFRFAYNNKANDKKLSYIIKPMDKKESFSDLPEVDIKPGTNRLEVDLTHHNGLVESHYYELKITDGKGQTYKLLFCYLINQ